MGSGRMAGANRRIAAVLATVGIGTLTASIAAMEQNAANITRGARTAS
jgi:hypothetical protein